MVERPLFDDTYTGPRWTYGLSLRPLGYARVPDGWIVSSDRPHPRYAHGTVDYPHPLDERQARQMDLELIEG
jgi:hypothetical protein